METIESCECANWCRDVCAYNIRDDSGLPIFTNHHRNCDKYNDSLITVWKVSYDGSSYHTDREPEGLEDGETVTEEKMHKEVYDRLPEFGGF